MPINWNSETDAKVISLIYFLFRALADLGSDKIQLFLGVLAQLKGLKMKLDYEALAAYMGPGMYCSSCRWNIETANPDRLHSVRNRKPHRSPSSQG